MQSQQLDVQAFINRARFSPYQWLVFALCFIIVLLDGFDTAAIGFIAPSLMKDWGIAKPDLAPVLSAALFGLVGGACFASAFADSLQQLTILRFITGLGLGAAMPSAVTLTSEFSPDAHRSVLTNAMFCWAMKHRPMASTFRTTSCMAIPARQTA